LLLWSANSPDFSLIECFWGLFMRHLKFRKITKVEELTNSLPEMCDNFQFEMINKLCATFILRFQICINAGCKSVQPFVSAKKYIFFEPPMEHLETKCSYQRDQIILQKHN
jgi:hypothetical protein